MKAFYNEIDAKTATWLRELVSNGHLTGGDVCINSIEDIQPGMLRTFNRCHFFAGIGGWEYALQLAGWPMEWEVWTGSCPCQPFSSAGKGKGFADERHLWPSWFWLIEQCRPNVIVGEQVSGAAGLAWFDIVSTDLEAIGYTIGSVTLPACSVGAPHIRQRLFWVAYSHGNGWQKGCEASATLGQRGAAFAGGWSGYRWISFPDGKSRPIESSIEPLAHGISAGLVRLRGYGNAIVPQVAAEFIRSFMEYVDV